jgi:hypothetical protein
MAEVKGGDKLEAYLNDLAKNLTAKAEVRVGFIDGATYPDDGSGKPVLVAMVAAIQNDGAPGAGIPKRPFFTDMVRQNSPNWGPELALVLKANGMDAAKSLALMGARIQGQLQDSIRAVQDPPLSPLTMAVRKFRRDNPGVRVTGSLIGELAAGLRYHPDFTGVSAKPLVDTGFMLRSVTFEVK